MLERHNWQQAALIASANGLMVDQVPLSYFISGDLSAGNARKDDSSARGQNLTVGFGIKPRYDLGVFVFATDSKLPATLHSTELPNSPFDQSENRADVGFNFKYAPDNQFWLKVGDGRQRNLVSGPYISQSTADALNGAFGTTIFGPNGVLDRFRSGIDQDDVQFRHAFTAGAVQWTWGAESSHQVRTGQLVTTFMPARLAIEQTYSLKASDAYVSARYQVSEAFTAQADLFSQHAKQQRSDLSTLDLLGPVAHFVLDDTNVERSYSELNPRFGLQWQVAAQQTLRLVAQKWRRPVSVGSLGEVDTLGISVNDRLPTAGGRYQRQRLQYDAELGRSSFVQAFIDHERIDNGLGGQRTAITDFELTQLESLRNRPEVFSPKADIEETPVFGEGTVNTLGLAANVLVNDRQTISARYLRRHSQQQGANAGLQIPFLSRDFVQLGSQWSLPQRWLLGVSAVYRGERFRDDTNLEPLKAGWTYGLTAYWETADKHSGVQFILDNLLSDKRVGLKSDAHLVLRYSHRF